MSVPLPTSVFGRSVMASPSIARGKTNGKQVAVWSVVAIVTGVAIALIIYFLVKMSKNNSEGQGHRNHRHHKIKPIPIHVNPPNPHPTPGPKPHPTPGPKPGPHHPVKPIHVIPHPTPTHLPKKPMPPQTFAGTLAPQVISRYEIFSQPCKYSPDRDLEPVEQNRYEYDNVEPLVGFDARPDNQVTSAQPYLSQGTFRAGATASKVKELVLYSRERCPFCIKAMNAGVHEIVAKAVGATIRKPRPGDKHKPRGVPALVDETTGKMATGFREGVEMEKEVERMIKDLGFDIGQRAGGFTAASGGAHAQVSASSPPAQASVIPRNHTGIVIMVMKGCGHCENLKKHVIPNLASKDVTVIDSQMVPDWLAEGVRGYPHTKCLREGKVVGEIPGYLPLEEFVAKLAKIYGQ